MVGKYGHVFSFQKLLDSQLVGDLCRLFSGYFDVVNPSRVDQVAATPAQVQPSAARVATSVAAAPQKATKPLSCLGYTPP